MDLQKKHAQVYLVILSSVEASVASGIAFSYSSYITSARRSTVANEMSPSGV